MIATRRESLIQALQLETEAATVKHALAVSRGWSTQPRLPIVPVAAKTACAIKSALDRAAAPRAHAREPDAPL